MGRGRERERKVVIETYSYRGECEEEGICFVGRPSSSSSPLFVRSVVIGVCWFDSEPGAASERGRERERRFHFHGPNATLALSLLALAARCKETTSRPLIGVNVIVVVVLGWCVRAQEKESAKESERESLWHRMVPSVMAAPQSGSLTSKRGVC